MDSDMQITIFNDNENTAGPYEADDFTYDGFQVVRSEFFSHINEPSVTFNNNKVSLNTASIKRLPEVSYVQFLVNPDTQKLAVRACDEDDKDSFRWCNEKRKPRQITCKIFFAMIADLMGWEPVHRYKLLGNVIRPGDDKIILFDLRSAEVYCRIIKDGEKPRNSRTPVLPDDWKNSFGIPYEEHKRLKYVNIIDGFTVFSIENNSRTASPEEGHINDNKEDADNKSGYSN